jgi:hypothetical protein
MSTDRHSRTGPLKVALGIALVSVVSLTMLVRDRWHNPEVKPAEQAQYSMTGEAAHAVGAQVIPTDPKLSVEPVAPGPKQAQPASPNYNPN